MTVKKPERKIRYFISGLRDEMYIPITRLLLPREDIYLVTVVDKGGKLLRNFFLHKDEYEKAVEIMKRNFIPFLHIKRVRGSKYVYCVVEPDEHVLLSFLGSLEYLELHREAYVKKPLYYNMDKVMRPFENRLLREIRPPRFAAKLFSQSSTYFRPIIIYPTCVDPSSYIAVFGYIVASRVVRILLALTIPKGIEDVVSGLV